MTSPALSGYELDQIYVDSNDASDTKSNRRHIRARVQSLPVFGTSFTTLRRQLGASLPTTVGDNPPLQPQTHSLIKEEHERIDMIPKTPEAELSQSPLDSFQPKPQQYFDRAGSATRRRKETIIDDVQNLSRPRRLGHPGHIKRAGQSLKSLYTPRRQRDNITELPLQRSSEKKLRKVPSSAPQLVETKGKYTFRKGVRIRDYHIPATRASTPKSWSSVYQCRDRFDRHEIPPRAPQAMKRKRLPESIEEVKHGTGEGVLMTTGNATPHRMISSESISDEDGGSVKVLESPHIKAEVDEGFEQWLARGAGSVSEGLLESQEID